MLHTIMMGIICSFAFLNYSFIITSFRDEANCGFKSFVPSLIYQNVGSNMKKKIVFRLILVCLLYVYPVVLYLKKIVTFSGSL